MNSNKCFTLAVALTVSLFVGWCQNLASSDSMVVVLKNDAVIIGEVTQTNDGISVRTSSGSTAEFRLNQVACLAESIDAAYEQLTSTADLTKPDELQRFFDWSLRHGLPIRSGELLAKAQTQNMDPAIIQLMQRRIDGALAEKRAAQNQPAAVAITPKTTVRVASQKEIDAAIKSLPSGSEAFFNQKLHARLIAGCAASKCHSRESESLSLSHDGKGVAVPRGYTRRNLHQVLRWVDRENPAASKLIEMAHTTHGGQTKPSFEQGAQSLQLLQYWTYAISQHPENYLTEVVGVSTVPTTAAVTASLPQTQAELPNNVVAQVGFVEVRPIPTVPEQTNGQPGSADEPINSGPCDPLLFNQTHHPDRVK